MLRLLGYLAAVLEEAGRSQEADIIRSFVAQHRWELLLLEDAYTQGRYRLPGYTSSKAEKGIEAATRLIELLRRILEKRAAMNTRVDALMARWFYELRSTWRKAAATVARGEAALPPGARVYVVGGAAEDRLTAVSDLDIPVVLSRDPPVPGSG